MAIKNNTLYPEHIALTTKTASEWKALNPVLISGEFGIESDTLRIKCGNGNNSWNNLEYLDAGIYSAIQANTQAIADITVRVEYLEELAEAIMETTTSVIRNIMRGEE